MQDRPTAPELLDALADFMRDRAAHARDRWERFQFQVAANSIGIVRRELEMEEGLLHDEWRGLDELLGAEDVPPTYVALKEQTVERNEELVRRIQGGDFDGEREPELQRHLLETVLAKVRVASPNERA
ncbi:MAG: DUF6285 domain-containing protein [Dehalococcoidia bacterium]